MITYAVHVQPDENRWVVAIPELGIRSQTRDRDTVLDLARDLVLGVVDELPGSVQLRLNAPALSDAQIGRALG